MKPKSRISHYRGAAVLLAALACQLSFGAEKITIAWAEWDPAKGLATIAREFTKESGIEVELNLVPWSDFTTHVKTALDAKSDKFDLVIGDSQWLGGAVESGHYLKLTETGDAGISLSGFVELTVRNYSEWPKGSKTYWGVPLMGDAMGWTYRKDWFMRPQLRTEFREKFKRELGPPQTWSELLDVAKFFQGREIDGKKVYGAAIFTDRAWEGITMGYSAAFYAWGARYNDPNKTYVVDGFVNSAAAAEALEAYKQLYKTGAPPNKNAFMGDTLTSFKSGEAAMMMNWFGLFPDLCKDPVVGGSKIGFFVNPSQKEDGSPLGGQGISVVTYSKKQAAALKFLKWFIRPEVQKKWSAAGGFSCHRSVLLDPAFRQSSPFAEAFMVALRQVRDFWQEPTYLELMKATQVRVHDFVVEDKGTAKEALDALAGDWKKIFKDAGRN